MKALPVMSNDAGAACVQIEPQGALRPAQYLPLHRQCGTIWCQQLLQKRHLRQYAAYRSGNRGEGEIAIGQFLLLSPKMWS